MIGSFNAAPKIHYEMDIQINNVPTGSPRYRGLFYCKSTESGLDNELKMPLLRINDDSTPELIVDYKMYGLMPDDPYSYYFGGSGERSHTLGGGTSYKLKVGETYHIEVDVDGRYGVVQVNGVVVSETILIDWNYAIGARQNCYLTNDVYPPADATVSNILVKTSSGISCLKTFLAALRCF